MTNLFDLKSARRDLLSMRSKNGANTPTGHRYSTLVEQLLNYEKTSAPGQRQNLRRLIRRSLDELGSIQ